MFFRKSKNRLSGFTLIELAIVLGVVGVLGASLWRLMSTSNQQTKDQNTAQQQEQLIASVKGFLASQAGQQWMSTLAPLSANNLALPSTQTWTVATCATNILIIPTAVSGFCSFLPSGFYYTSPGVGTTNPYGQTYSINVLKDNAPLGSDPTTYSFMIVASGTGISIPDVDGGRISSMIGGDGGFVYSSSSVCGFTSPTACGALGAWTASTATYGFAAPPGGSIASRTFVSPTADNSNLWLAREYLSEGTPLNTMTTNLYMGTSAAAPSISSTNIYMADGTEISGTGSASILLAGTGTGHPGAVSPEVRISGDMTPLYNVEGAATNSLLYVLGSCAQSVPNDPNCQFAMQITGDASVSNFLIAKDVYAYNLSYNSSDRRLKKNIQTLSDPLDDVMKINPVSFTFKDSGKNSMGVIAQELAKIYPQLVVDGPGGYKSVAYDGLIAPLIGAVQELKNENDDLRAQLRDQAEHQEKTDQELAKLRQ